MILFGKILSILKNKNGLGKLGLKKEWKRVYEDYHLDKGGKNMSIFQELKEKIVFPPNWKDNLMAHKKYEKLYKKIRQSLYTVICTVLNQWKK
ncbi:hypothetical protein AAHH67_14535 [Niallia circulans]